MAKHFAQIDGGDTGPKPVTEIPVIERASEEADDEPNLELEVLKSSYDSEGFCSWAASSRTGSPRSTTRSRWTLRSRRHSWRS